ncbi:hypothetical protein PanWU01x14_163270 [Parasponia andersonii]|uniref:Uncharacterized protein n=1 Tax=Parasponia andersonii TaxID=3476 RepID=A0A2P5CCN5_PARAD|nr:hypothetical protein PanWU01x14_163270 [Parasponia andersonii]
MDLFCKCRSTSRPPIGQFPTEDLEILDEETIVLLTKQYTKFLRRNTKRGIQVESQSKEIKKEIQISLLLSILERQPIKRIRRTKASNIEKNNNGFAKAHDRSPIIKPWNEPGIKVATQYADEKRYQR